MRRILSVLAMLAVSACAGMPGREAIGTPAEAVTRASYVAIVIGAPPLLGGLGSGVALDGQHVMTSAHVMEMAGIGIGGATLVRGDGMRASARVIGRSDRMDLAVLRVEDGFVVPAMLAQGAPKLGAPVWAAGTTTIGPGLSAGVITAPIARLEGRGEGFVARIGALMGYSGGPVVGADGAVLGLTTALVEPGAAPALGLVFGADVDGLVRRSGRDVFILGIGQAAEEARRLIEAAR